MRTTPTLFFLLLIMLALTNLPTPAASQSDHTLNLPLILRPPRPLSEQTIAFCSNRNGNRDIYLINGDGSGERALTNTPSDECVPLWSPDGSQLAFLSDRDGDTEIFVMQADGTNVRQLTFNTCPDYDMAWSPDSTQLAYLSCTAGISYNLYRLSVSGPSTPVLVAEDVLNTPSWSYDGTYLIYEARRNNQPAIYTRNLTTNAEQFLTVGIDPAFAPDSYKIAFVIELEVFTINVDGTEEKLIANHSGGVLPAVRRPLWSPDGQKLSYHFISGMSPGDPLRLMVASGLNDDVPTVTHLGPGVDSDWSSDSAYLTFRTIQLDPNLPPQVAVISPDGTYFMRLTSVGQNDYPRWRPIP